MATDRPVPGHGTRARYLHRSDPCHCPECTAANTAYIRHWRAELAGTRPTVVVHPRQLEMFA